MMMMTTSTVYPKWQQCKSELAERWFWCWLYSLRELLLVVLVIFWWWWRWRYFKGGLAIALALTHSQEEEFQICIRRYIGFCCTRKKRACGFFFLDFFLLFLGQHIFCSLFLVYMCAGFSLSIYIVNERIFLLFTSTTSVSIFFLSHIYHPENSPH